MHVPPPPDRDRAPCPRPARWPRAGGRAAPRPRRRRRPTRPLLHHDLRRRGAPRSRSRVTGAARKIRLSAPRSSRSVATMNSASASACGTASDRAATVPQQEARGAGPALARCDRDRRAPAAAPRRCCSMARLAHAELPPQRLRVRADALHRLARDARARANGGMPRCVSRSRRMRMSGSAGPPSARRMSRSSTSAAMSAASDAAFSARARDDHVSEPRVEPERRQAPARAR